MEHFLIVLALCHTVHVSIRSSDSIVDSTACSQNGGANFNEGFEFVESDLDYQASSPDEKALLEACRR